MNQQDVSTIEKQIGRVPLGVMEVTKRCVNGCPQAVLVSPYQEERGFFPTLFWLTCPALRKSVSTLESTGYLRVVREIISTDEEFMGRLLAANAAYIEKRMLLLEGNVLYADHNVLVGIGGSANPLSVKCLHMHVADYISGGNNPIGEKCIEYIKENNYKLVCDDAICGGIK